MSIIHEALKKVQITLRKQTPETIEHVSTDGTISVVKKIPEAVPAPAVKSSPRGLALIMAAALLVTAGYLFRSHFKITDLQRNMPHFQIAKPRANRPSPASRPSGPAPTTTPSGNHNAGNNFNIQGVMTNNTGSPVALINNQIYEVGSAINGGKILSIEPETITVSTNGKVERILVHH